MRAAMLWEYLQGTPADTIQRAAYIVDRTYIAKVGSIRTVFLSFIERKYQKEFQHRVQSLPRKSSSRTLSDEALLANTSQMGRDYEQEALEAYRQSRKPELRNSDAERSGLCTRLTAKLGGNQGAYRKIFSLVAEVVVEDEDLSDARGRLWVAVERNLQQAPSQAAAARLNNEEVKWLAPLCGKKLVPDPKTKSLSVEDMQPETLNDMRIKANNLYTRNMYGEQPPRSADDVEFIILEACRKLLKSA
jgi:hypothetical protein